MKLALIFNGQGAHYEKMGEDFVKSYDKAKETFELAEDVTQLPIRSWINNDIDQLAKTRYAQPAILTTSLAIYEAIKDQLPAISFMAGLSLGEYSALIASGMISLEEGLKLVKERGEMMSNHCESLSKQMAIQMAAVIDMPFEAIKTLVDELHSSENPLYIANYNSAQQIVIAGSKQAITQFRKAAKADGYRAVIPLKVEGPFHTPLMQAVQEPFVKALNEIEVKPADITVISNTTVEPHSISSIKETLTAHLTEPVKWLQTIEAFKQDNITHIIQIGPGNTLASFLKNDKDVKVLVINNVEDAEKLEDFLAEGEEV